MVDRLAKKVHEIEQNKRTLLIMDEQTFHFNLV